MRNTPSNERKKNLKKAIKSIKRLVLSFFLVIYLGLPTVLYAESRAIIVTVDGLSFINTYLGDLNIPSIEEECENYLENALESMDLSVDDNHIIPFSWSRDAGDSDQAIEDLRLFLRQHFTTAKDEGKKFIVISHSWGTFLTYLALSYESTVEIPIYCDLYITLGSPLGTYYAHDGLYVEEILINGYVNTWLDSLNFSSCTNCYPRAERCVNYWAWGDLISGPLGDFMPLAENIKIDPFSSQDGHEYRNAGSTGYVWHYYDSLQANGSADNQPLKDKVRSLIEETIEVASALSSPGVQPSSGDINTLFQLRVTYTDPENNPPDDGSVKLILDEQEYEMSTSDTNYADGSVFVYPASGGIKLMQGIHEYYFEAAQGGEPTQGSPTSTLCLTVSEPSAGQVTVQLSPSEIEVFDSTAITATVKDSDGTPLQGVTVNFSQNLFPGLISPTSDVTDSNGKATSTFTPSASGTALITAQVDDGPSGSAYLTVVPGSVRFQLQLRKTSSGNIWELLAKLLNNDIPWDYEDVTFTLSPSSMANFMETSTATLHTRTNSAGNVFTDVDVKQYGTLTITATHDSTGTTSSITVSIQEGGGTEFAAFKNLGQTGSDVDWSGNGDLIAITSWNTALIQDALGSHNVWRTISLNNSGGSRGVVFSPDSKKIFIAGEGNPEEMAVLTLNYPSGTPSVDYSNNDHGKIEYRACDWEGSRILTGRTNDPECELYYTSLNTARSIDMPDDVTGVAFDKTNSSRFAFGDDQGNVKAYTTGGSQLWSRSLNEETVHSAAWRGDEVLVGGKNGMIWRYSASGSARTNLSHGTGPVTCLEFSPDGQWLASCGGGGIKIWSTSSWTETYSGPSATCVAWDTASTYLVDNSGNLYAPFDQSPPTIMISSPYDGYETFNTTVTVTGMISDSLGIKSAMISVNGGAAEGLTLDAQDEFSHQVSLSPGVNTIRIDATEGGGKSAYVAIMITRNQDTDGPLISNVIATPSEATIGSVFTISAQVADAHSAIEASSVTCHIQLPDETDVDVLTMYDDGTHGDESSNDSIYTAEWTSSSATEDNYLVDITASDSAANSAQVENACTLSTYDFPAFGTPEVTPASPTDTDEVTVTIDITDSSGISSKTLWYQPSDATNWVPRDMSGVGPSYTSTIPMLEEGIVKYKIEATDVLGHTSESTAYQYTVTDGSLPVAWNWSRSPSDITELTTGTVLVSVKVVDAGGSGLAGNPQIDYRLSHGSFDGWEEMTLAGGDLWKFEIPDLGWGLNAGKTLEYKVRALDNRGNELITPVQMELIDEINIADLSVTKTDYPDPVVAGTELTYTITISNAGPSDARNVTLTDTMPPEIQGPEYSTDEGVTWSSWTGSVSLGTISEGDSHQVLIRGIVSPSTTNDISNTAKVSTEADDPDSDNDNEVQQTSVSPIPGALSIAPQDGFSSLGREGGPFSPSSKTYTLENKGGSSIDWTASKTQGWVDLSKVNGMLAPGETDIVTVSINNSADSLSEGNYSDTVVFTNITNGNGDTTRSIYLTVNPLCTYSISPRSQSFSELGGTGSVSVTAQSGCDWTATSNEPWITITSGSSGSGEGTLNFSVAVNDTQSPRGSTLTIAEQGFMVTQSGVILYDDFEDGVIDPSKWVHNGWSGGTLSESNGTLYFETGSSSDQQLRTAINIGQYDEFTITFKIKPEWVSGDKNVGFWLGNLAEGDIGDGTHRGYYLLFHGKTQGIAISAVYDSNAAGLHDKYDPPNWSPGAWYPVKVVRSNSVIEFFFDDELIGADSTYASQMTELFWVTGRPWKEGLSGEAAKIYIDDFKVNSPYVAPIGGYTEDNVIPSVKVNQSNDGMGTINVRFKIRHASGANCTLHSFQYSVDGGDTWNAPGDDSESLSSGWQNNNSDRYSSAQDFENAQEHSFTINTKHQDLAGLDGEDQSDVQVRFTVNDGSYDSLLPVTSESFRVDNREPAVAISYSEPDPYRDADAISVKATFIEGNEIAANPQIAIDYAGEGDDLSATDMTATGDNKVWTYLMDVPSGNDGTATITITGFDAAGNTVGTHTGNTFTVDNTAPTIQSYPNIDYTSNTIEVTYSESNMQNATQEANYSFSPSLNFTTLGGSDDITNPSGGTYRLAMSSVPVHTILTLTVSNIIDAAGNSVIPSSIKINDNDRDNMADDWESHYNLDNSIEDSDNDGLTDVEEFDNATAPDDPDTDNDNLPDGWEVSYGLNPLADDASGDFDEDGYNNLDEYLAGTNPTDQADFPESRPPDQPVLISPSSVQNNVSLTPELQTGDFSDPDGDIHGETEWQISTESNFSTRILDITSDTHLTSLTVPDSVLEESTTYYWRVRFYDNHDAVSEWSDAYSFTTITTSNDTDFNGIPDEQEVDEMVDLDENGTPDVDQDDIMCVNTVVGEGHIGVQEGTNVESIECLRSIDPDTITETTNRPEKLPLGLISFKVKVDTPGDTAVVVIYLSEPAPSDARWYKYDSVNSWQDYSDHATFSTDRKSVTLELKDGGHGDADGAENGFVVDPSGCGAGNQAPTASFTADTTSGEAPLRVIFDASGSNDPDGTIESYDWDFGDNSSGSAELTSHEYTLEGTYTVTLTVTDDDGATDTTTATITVTEPAPTPTPTPTPSPAPTSGGGDGDGCFIATAAYGSSMEPHVKVLREFCDRFLLTNPVGTAFVDLYDKYSTPVADFIARHDTVRLMVRWSLLPLLGASWMALNSGPWVTMAVVVLLICLTYAGTRFVLRRMQFRHQV